MPCRYLNAIWESWTGTISRAINLHPEKNKSKRFSSLFRLWDKLNAVGLAAKNRTRDEQHESVLNEADSIYGIFIKR